MDVSGDYAELGYLHVRRLIPPEVARALIAALKEDLGRDGPYADHAFDRRADLRPVQFSFT
jgi:hypothetical protein